MSKGTRLRKVSRQDIDNLAKVQTGLQLRKHELEHQMLALVKKAR